MTTEPPFGPICGIAVFAIRSATERGRNVVVDFVAGVIDEEKAPEFNVSGVSGIERISPNQMRISYFVERKGERRSVAHMVWDRQQWLQQWLQWDLCRGDISSELFELQNVMDDGTPKEIH